MQKNIKNDRAISTITIKITSSYQYLLLPATFSYTANNGKNELCDNN